MLTIGVLPEKISAKSAKTPRAPRKEERKKFLLLLLAFLDSWRFFGVRAQAAQPALGPLRLCGSFGFAPSRNFTCAHMDSIATFY